MSKIVLGIDFGLKYLGIALGDTITKNARALTCILVTNQQQTLIELQTIIAKWQPNLIVLGDPGTKKNAKIIHEKVLQFKDVLQQHYKLPVELTPEDFTTWQAKKNIYHNALDQKTLLKINAEAAKILLEQWLRL